MLPVSVLPVSLLPVSLLPLCSRVLPVSVLPVSLLPVSLLPVSVLPVSVLPVSVPAPPADWLASLLVSAVVSAAPEMSVLPVSRPSLPTCTLPPSLTVPLGAGAVTTDPLPPPKMALATSPAVVRLAGELAAGAALRTTVGAVATLGLAAAFALPLRVTSGSTRSRRTSPVDGLSTTSRMPPLPGAHEAHPAQQRALYLDCREAGPAEVCDHGLFRLGEDGGRRRQGQDKDRHNAQH